MTIRLKRSAKTSISPESDRQIEAKALRKLRHPSRAKTLRICRLRLSPRPTTANRFDVLLGVEVALRPIVLGMPTVLIADDMRVERMILKRSRGYDIIETDGEKLPSNTS